MAGGDGGARYLRPARCGGGAKPNPDPDPDPDPGPDPDPDRDPNQVALLRRHGFRVTCAAQLGGTVRGYEMVVPATLRLFHVYAVRK